MSGRFMTLRPGHYIVAVSRGEGPAGVHRGAEDVRLDRGGGEASFRVEEAERVYVWWRGGAETVAVRAVGTSSPKSMGDKRIA